MRLYAVKDIKYSDHIDDLNSRIIKVLRKSKICKDEELILTNGMFPLISLCTHARPECRETCIDNILTNEVSSVIMSGTIEQSVSHHFSIFQFTNSPGLCSKRSNRPVL